MAARARMIRMWRAGFEMRWGLRRDDFFSKVQGGRGDEEELPSVPGAVGLRRTEGCASALLAFGSVITPPGRFSKSGVGIALLWFGESGGQMSLGLPSMLTAIQLDVGIQIQAGTLSFSDGVDSRAREIRNDSKRPSVR